MAARTRQENSSSRQNETSPAERGKDDGAAAMAGGGDGELVGQTLGLDLVATVENLNDTLDMQPL